MEKFVDIALEKAEELKIQAEVRLTFHEEEIVRVKGLETEITGYEQVVGLGVTAYDGGSYGFASTSVLTPEAVAEAVKSAYAVARARAEQRKQPLLLPELPKYVDQRKSSYAIDPFKVPVDEKIGTLLKVNEEAYRYAGENGILPVSMIRSFKKKTFYANTNGSRIVQEFVSCGAEAQVYAFSDGDLQVRSYPSRDASYYQKGYEVVEEIDLMNGVRNAVEEVLQLVKANEIEPGLYDAVISQDQMSLQIHESIGHPSELDRALGYEVSLAGASFLTLDKRGSYQLASPVVNVIADARAEGALGSFFYDDEGTPAQKFYIVENGIFKNYLMSRESAISLGETSNGCARAESALKLPIVRMTNLFLEPDENGPQNLEEMISEIKEGVFLKTTKSWSIDDLRLNFQFAVELAREIKNGKLGRYFKNTNYTGITPSFWKSVETIGNEKTFQMFGFTNCGKGDPIQLASVGHGSPLVLVRNLKVGVAR